ncbi:uncharacterized protein LOC124268556 [Haliotis rubra]|uniref:uncharacterized protein LOC124268556 n=1 Tax=Haliotis rubra TaxID=36100 RepID=UPI001EE53207|nr:uncharacterized protein LOC124268556 [Haliotis rubra]
MADGRHSFHIADYAVFGATILISLGIGLYFALSGGRQKTTSEFLVGGRAMKFLPVAVSLMVSFESSIMMLGTPAEVYVYGAQVWISLFGFLSSFLICRVLMIPLIHPLKITSAYEYLDGRFKSRVVRQVGTALGVLTYVFYMGIVLFGPAIALEAVTGFPQSGSIVLVASAAILYTAMGGLKAVIWTDVFQAFVMFAGMLAVIIKGTLDAGGINSVWTTAAKGGRLNFFSFDPDPTVRHTFWGLFLGTFARSSGLIFNQSTIQRVCSTPTLAAAKKVMLIVSPAFWITITLAMIEGIVAYAYYVNLRCDPLESDKIHNPNQIIPFMVMDIFRGLPGMPGLFLAALFSASLSTISSGLSSLSAMTWEDILKPRLPNVSDLTATMIAKVSVVVFGALSCGVAILISLIGGTLTQITSTVLAAFNGPLCGLFILASLCPWANAKGAVISTVISTIIMIWLCAGSTFSGATRPTPWLTPAPTDQCSADNMTSLVMNTTGLMTSSAELYDVTTVATVAEPVTGFNVIYTLSYTWLGAVGIAIVLIVGFFVSWATGFNKDGDLDPRYVIYLSEVVKNILRCGKKSTSDEKSERKDSIYNTEIEIELEKTTETEIPLLTDAGKDKTVSHLPSHINDVKDEHKPWFIWHDSNRNRITMVSRHSFHIVDYVVFGATVLISLGIGLYFALSGGRQKTTAEFLVGGRAMKFLPVALSLMVSFESSIMMLGIPAEVYVYGAQVWIGMFGWLTVLLLTNRVLVPMIHPLKITSAYEYLDGRFNSRAIRLIGTTLGILHYIFYMGVVLFGPAIAIEAVTGFPLIWSIILVASAAIMYTSMGGLKAVIWTDVFQCIIMFSGMFAVLIKGTIDVGGVRKVWTTAYEGGRLNILNFDPNPTVRHTFWGLYIGTIMKAAGIAFNQSTIQRVCATPTMKEAKKVVFVMAPGFWLTITLAIVEGVVAYAYYNSVKCDPLLSGQITNPNQVIPLFVMDIFKDIPGMPGLFLAALFSASLSTVSSGLSSLSALTWEDILKPHLPNISEFKATVIAKVSVIVYGLLAVGVAILTSIIGGTLIEISGSVLATFTGPLTGLFLTAFFCPWANAKGCFTGTIVGTAVLLWISFGSTFSGVKTRTPWLPPAQSDMCFPENMTSSAYNSSLLTSARSMYTVGKPVREPIWIEYAYQLSYAWFSALGSGVTFVVSFLVSWMTGFNRNNDVDPRYMVSFTEKLCCCIPRCICGQSKEVNKGQTKQDVHKSKDEPQDGTEMILLLKKSEQEGEAQLPQKTDEENETNSS